MLTFFIPNIPIPQKPSEDDLPTAMASYAAQCEPLRNAVVGEACLYMKEHPEVGPEGMFQIPGLGTLCLHRQGSRFEVQWFADVMPVQLRCLSV